MDIVHRPDKNHVNDVDDLLVQCNYYPMAVTYRTCHVAQDSWLVYVRSCSVCNRQKKYQKKPKAHQVRYHAVLPLERIHIDILGTLIKTPRVNQYVLVGVNQLSKWV